MGAEAVGSTSNSIGISLDDKTNLALLSRVFN